MDINYHELLPIDGRSFATTQDTYIARVVNIPAMPQNSTTICYSIDFKATTQPVVIFSPTKGRQLNLWVALETLTLDPDAKTKVFNAVDNWLVTDEGYAERPDRFFDETTASLIPYDPQKGPIGDQPSRLNEKLTSLASRLSPVHSRALRSAWSMKNLVQRVQSLSELASELPRPESNEIYTEAVQTILEIPDANRRAEAAAKLAEKLPESLLLALLEGLKTESDEHQRALVINPIVRFLSMPALRQLSEYARTLGTSGGGDSLFANLANWVAEKGDVELAFTLVEEISDVELRDGTVASLMRFTKRPVVTEKTSSIDGSGEAKSPLGQVTLTQSTNGELSDEQSVGELIKIATRALADTPNEKLDLLDFSDYADALSAFISSDRTEKPLTVGIDAAWGMGKTQLMRMVKERLTAPGGADLNKRVKARSSFPTVWFNAWKYDREEALWAALVLEILEQIRKELGFWKRMELSLRLGWRRFDKKSLLGPVFISAIASVLAVILLLLLRSNLLVGSVTFGVAGVLSFLAAVFPVGKRLYEQIKPLPEKISKYIRHPNYKERVGFLAQFEEDFRRVVDLVTEEGKWPLVVFIDDLDRCAPPRAVEVVEAINILLDAKHCVFIIGMDAKAVGQSIESKYKELNGIYSDDRVGLTLGERFLEKIVQISFRIPRAHKDQVEQFIDKNLSALKEVDLAKAIQLPRDFVNEEVKLAEQIIQAEQRAGKNLSEATKSVEADPNLISGGVSREDIKQASEEVRRSAFEDDKNVRQAMTEAAPYLDFNPRKIKRFINNFRLHALIAQKRGLIGADGVKVSLLAKAVIISTCWPDVVKSASNDPTLLSRLKQAYEGQDSLRQSFPRDATETEATQLKLNELLTDGRVTRFIDAANLARLLIDMDTLELESLLSCFALQPVARTAPD